ncbi:MAG: ATP-binding cassette domain-containing protein [Acidobacteriales bacterium]|nr:ATP-binding cassette domain-containing protein [Terriglobales bacterium]
MNTVEVAEVVKAYDKKIAVDHLSFSIRQGSIFGLLGPNGAGKTSTIRMLIGITLPDSGTVRIFGEPFRRALLQRIGYLPEQPGLYRKLKVLEQLVMLGELHGLRAQDAKKRATEWCERLEIAGSLGSKYEELSKGMQQKVQFIASLLHDPEFLIMDEPFSGLDPVNAKLLKDTLLDLRQQGKTVLFSSHRMDQVEKLCDDICLVNGGKAVLNGNLREIKARYGKSSVQIEYDGDRDVLRDNSLVKSLDKYENYVEVQMIEGADSQALLKMLVDRSRINKFEVVEPSLDEIFREVVGRVDA